MAMLRSRHAQSMCVEVPMNTEEKKAARWLLNRAIMVAANSPCLRFHFGAVLVSENGRILGVGCNEPPLHLKPCEQCLRQELNIKSSTHYEICRTVHAEQWAIIRALQNNDASELYGSTMFIAGKQPEASGLQAKPANNQRFRCTLCARFMDAAGVRYLVLARANEKAEDGWEPYKVDICKALEDSFSYTIEAVTENKELWYND